MESVVARFLATFRQRSPDIEIKLVEDGSARLSQRLESGDLELAVTGLPSNSALEGRPLLPLGLLAVVPSGSRFGGHSRIDIGDLASETMLLLKPQFMTRRIFDDVCQVANVNPHVLIESNSPHCLLALVRSRQGIAVVPSTVLLGPLEDRAIPICHGDRILCFCLTSAPMGQAEVSDNGSSCIAGDLAEWLDDGDIVHIRGAPNHPRTQGKIERWHQTLKNRILLENYSLPGDLEAQVGAFVEHHNHRRYHESRGNLTPADVYFGRDKAIIERRKSIKKQTIEKRRLAHRRHAA